MYLTFQIVTHSCYSKKFQNSEFFKEGDYYYISKTESLLPAGTKTLDECKGKLINDYQQFLEQNWVADLKKEFVVTISKANFEKVKKQLKK